MPPLHVHDGQARPCTSSVADPSPPPGGMDRPTQGRRQGTDPQQPHVCPPRVEEVRQQVRQVRIMSEVQPEASVVRQAAGLAGRWARAFAQIFFAGALICGDLAHQHDLLPQVQTGSPSSADSKVFTSSFHEQFEQATSSYSGASPSGHRRDGPLPGHDGGGRRDGLHRDLQRRGLGIASRCTIAPGVRKRLTGKVNNALHAITKEYQIYQTNSLYCKSRADIMEAFAGSAKISKMSSAYGLKAVTPLHFNTGVDLSTKHGQDICNSLMDRYHPLFFFAEIDCRPWVLLQDNVNFLHRPHELQSCRDSVRPMVARTASWCLKQHNAGRYFLIENPDNSRLWAEPTIDELRQLTNAFEVKCHHGAYGASSRTTSTWRTHSCGSSVLRHFNNAFPWKGRKSLSLRSTPAAWSRRCSKQSDAPLKSYNQHASHLAGHTRCSPPSHKANPSPTRPHGSQSWNRSRSSSPEPPSRPRYSTPNKFSTRTFSDLYRGTSTDCSFLLRPSLSDNLDTYLIRIVELSCSTPGMKFLPSSLRTSPRFTFPAGDFPELWMWESSFSVSPIPFKNRHQFYLQISKFGFLQNRNKARSSMVR